MYRYTVADSTTVSGGTAHTAVCQRKSISHGLIRKTEIKRKIAHATVCQSRCAINAHVREIDTVSTDGRCWA